MSDEEKWFKITELVPVEIDEPGKEFESNIIDWGEDFYLKVSFEGPHSEAYWHNMTDMGAYYQVEFYAHAVSPDTNDLKFDVVDGNLKPEKMSYEVKSQTTNVKGEGTWECGAIVTFYNNKKEMKRYHGVVGFNHGCLLRVDIAEEPH